MKALKAALEALRVRLGWGTLSQTRLTPPHGWLLRGAPKPIAIPAERSEPR
jgi:hypothetical protein